VKEPTLRDLHGRARQLINKLEWFDIEHVLRGHNREADELANAAMDKGSGRTPFRAPQAAPGQREQREFDGIVRGGKIEILNGELPDGTAVEIRIKPGK
jgi:probable phosphoglycerate mutase